MAIPCPACGRQYDVALFQFGRTIHCTCGRRVGMERRLDRPRRHGPPRFFADVMLGRLARWLRILGFDTAYEARIADEQLVRRAILEARTILTRDRALPEEWRVGCVHVVAAERTLEQLREIIDAFALGAWVRPFTRCSRCNADLVDVEPDEVAAAVPERVLAARPRLRKCVACRRVYWEGSHTARMRRVVDDLLARQ